MQLASLGRLEYNKSHFLHRLLLLLLLVRACSRLGPLIPPDLSPPMHQPTLVTPLSLVLDLDSPPIKPLIVALPRFPIPSTPIASSHFST